MGDEILALAVHDPALRPAGAHDGRCAAGVLHGKEVVKAWHRAGFFHPKAFAEYVRCFNWKTIRGSYEDYRACASCDFEMDEADYQAGRKIEVPLLVTWGSRSHTGSVHGDVLSVWRDYATNATGGPIDCGHYVPEEAPDAVYAAFMRHFRV